jgi:hypothetical protein
LPAARRCTGRSPRFFSSLSRCELSCLAPLCSSYEDRYEDENAGYAPQSRAPPRHAAPAAHGRARQPTSAPLGDNFVHNNVRHDRHADRQGDREVPAMPAICRGASNGYTNTHGRLAPAAYYNSYSGMKIVNPPGGHSQIVF